MQPFVGEIRMFGGSFAPNGWMLCEGAVLPIAENEVLFQLIGTTYGGDGEETFALPNLASRVPIHQGAGGGGTYIMGETGGVEQVSLTQSQIPIHNHAFLVTADNGSASNPENAMPGAGTAITIFRPVPPNPGSAMSNQSISIVGGSQPHDNLQPYLVINYIISLFGIYPSPN
jgi:microcystin-dependent protein